MIETGENPTPVDYVPGSSPRELARLERQAVFFREMTADVLLQAGLEPGMRVLDLGCGVGDVSLIASEIVGPSGRVLGLDQSQDAIAIARRRMMAAGRHQVDFRHGSLETFEAFGDFDAVIGRFILVHLPHARQTVARIAQRAREGAIIAFCELDLGATMTTAPSPLFERGVKLIMDVFDRSGRKANMGSDLYATFRSAGLEPKLSACQRVGSSREVAGLDFLTESVRTMVPAIEMLGIGTAAEIDVDTLMDRLIAEANATDACIFYPRFVGAWARA